MVNATQNKAPRQPRKRPERFVKLIGKGKDTMLVIRTVRPRAGDRIDAYALEPFASHGGRGLLLHKPDKTSYAVYLAGADSVCDCKGFEAHNHCKHVEALRALESAGRL